MKTVNEIRLAALSKRHALGLSQDQLAIRTGVSRKWISEFERGKAAAELGLVLRLLNGLDLEIVVTQGSPTATTATRSKKDDKTGTKTSASTLVNLDELLSEYHA
jgi:HTH-type transcriptional regulator/antitoxin HipB